MRRYVYGVLLLSCCSQVAAETFEEQIMKEFHESLKQMRTRFDAIEEYFNNIEKEAVVPLASSTTEKIKISTKKTVEVTSDANFVVVKLNLGDLDSKEISIEAEGNTLDGKVPLKNGVAKFSVQNGRLFEFSMKHEQKEEKKGDKDASFQRVEASAATRIESLPEIVANLEETKVSYKDGVVELKLPKVSATQKKTKKLNVDIVTK